MSDFPMYGLKDETLKLVGRIKDWDKISSKECILKRIKGIAPETKNSIDNEVKYLIILEKQHMDVARKWVNVSFNKRFEKYARVHEIKGYILPGTSLEENTLPLIGEWKA